MLQYFIILLDGQSTSFCHHNVAERQSQLIDTDTLRRAIRFAMMENMTIQFVYPVGDLPEQHKRLIESIDHSKIVSSLCEDDALVEEADIVVFHDWSGISYGMTYTDKSYVLRTTKTELLERHLFLKEFLSKVARLNIVIIDIETFNDADFEKYKLVLNALSEHIEKLYVDGKSPQLNLLTDRMMLKEMNNCGAGDANITLAPNGKFYVCPAFYINNEEDGIGNIEHGLDIKNKQLYQLDHAPICSHCDAYQCKRCIWLNRKTTLEVNTPSHEQCVVAHLERNASQNLLTSIRKHGVFLPEMQIKEIDYLDPFDKRNDW